MHRIIRTIRAIYRTHRETVFISLFIIVISIGLLWLSQRMGKSVWEFVELLIIPAVLGIVAWLFNRAARKRDIEIENDRQRQAVLTTYFDQMTDLILSHDLGNSKSKSKRFHEVRSIARARTLSALRNLDGWRKGQVVRFLYESGLIDKKPAIDLKLADLKGAELLGASLEGAHLSYANLSGAHLDYANLQGANLLKTNLSGAYMISIDLQRASLAGASLRNADMERAKLQEAVITPSILKDFQPDEDDLRRALQRGIDFKSAMRNAPPAKGIVPIPISPKDAIMKDANFKGADVTPRWLQRAKTLEGATMPDGSEYEDWVAKGSKAW
ncbi:pentapeptide repeat-containing protein [Chloroflexota bacterium]